MKATVFNRAHATQLRLFEAWRRKRRYSARHAAGEAEALSPKYGFVPPYVAARSRVLQEDMRMGRAFATSDEAKAIRSDGARAMADAGYIPDSGKFRLCHPTRYQGWTEESLKKSTNDA